MTTEAPVKVCTCGETRRCVLCTPGMFPAVIRLRRSRPVTAVTDAEIIRALKNTHGDDWPRFYTPTRVQAVRENIEIGKRCGSYRPNE